MQTPVSLSLVRGTDRAFTRFGAMHTGPYGLDARLPSFSDHALDVRAYGDEARSLAIRPLDVATVRASTVEGALLFADVAPSTDLLYGRAGDSVEELRVLRDATAPSRFRWSLTGGRSVHDVRVREGRVEAVDARGHVLVSSAAPFAVDHVGLHRDLALSIEKRADESYVLTASLETKGLAFPVVVDPVWIGGPTMSVSRSNHVAALEPATGKVWLGCGGSNSFDVYDPATDTITPIAATTPNFLNRCAVTFSGTHVFVAGDGHSETYDTGTKAWTNGATPTNTAGQSFIAALADGRILQMGGAVTSAVNTVEVYDGTTNTWTTKAPMKVARSSALTIRLASGKILVAGGNDMGTLTTAEVYDPTADTWTATGVMPSARDWGGAIALLPSGKVIVGGGSSVAGNTTAIYDPSTNNWTAGPTLLANRNEVAAAASVDGRVFFFGGTPNGESQLASVDEIDAALAAVKPALSMVVPRVFASATLLRDQRIFVAGGANYTSVSSTETFYTWTNGTACTFGGECASGQCVDGVCCASACGTCMRCDVAGKEGTCNPSDASTGCGASGTCAGSTLTPRGHCSGTDGTCVAATGVACAGGLTCADATNCKLKCVNDADCTTGRCDSASGLCLLPLPDAGPEVEADTGTPDTGAPDTGTVDTGTVEDAQAAAPVPEGAPKLLGSAKACTSGSECETGFCVDGVCCDTACKEICHSCALPSSPGRCSEEPLGVDLRAECGPALSCSGTCGKGGVCTPSTKGTQCAPSTCTGPTTGKGAAYCVAHGQACPIDEQVPFDCGAYVCDPAFGACRTSCTSSDNCASGFVCDPNSKSCTALPADTSSGCAVATPGLVRNGLFGALALLGLSRFARRRSRRG